MPVNNRLNVYLDVAEMTSQSLVFTLVESDELLANVFTLGAQGFGSVDMNAMETGLHAIDDTTNLDGAVDGSLFQHKFTADISALDINHGTTRAFDGFAGATSDSNNCLDAK